MAPDDIIAAARAAIGTPFRHQGRTAGSGLDCVGLGAHVLTTLGIPYVDQEGYGRRPSEGRLEAALAGQPRLVKVPRSDLRAGDFLLMRFFKAPQHLAIFTGDTVIHAWETAGKVCEHRLDDAWKKRIVAVYRIVEVDA